jgi:hypothetical protein
MVTASHLALQALDPVRQRCQLALEVLLLLLQVTSVKLRAADGLTQLLGSAAAVQRQQVAVQLRWWAVQEWLRCTAKQQQAACSRFTTQLLWVQRQ